MSGYNEILKINLAARCNAKRINCARQMFETRIFVGTKDNRYSVLSSMTVYDQQGLHKPSKAVDRIEAVVRDLQFFELVGDICVCMRRNHDTV
jgi:hypothetical protein